MSKRKEVTDLLKELRAAGYEVRLGKSGHYKVYDDGTLITTMPVSPSDRRWTKNLRAAVRSRGSKPI